MVDWLRHARADEIANGFFKFINTNLKYGDDGITGLLKHVPIAQTEWLHDGTANHALSYQFDAGSSRIMSRITAAAGGAITSRIRKNLILPRDFGSFEAFGFQMAVRGSNALPTSVTMTVKRNGTADGTVNDLSIIPSTHSVFEVKQISITSLTYLAQDQILLEFKVTTANNGEWAEIGEVQLSYLTKGGNVP